MMKTNLPIRRLVQTITFILICVTFSPNTYSQTKGAAKNYWVPKEVPKAHYKIDCSINPANGEFKGREIIRIRNAANRPVSRLAVEWMSGGDQTIGIKVDGKPVSISKKSDSDVMVIELPEAIAAKEEKNIEIEFSFRGPGNAEFDMLPMVDLYPRLWWGFETHNDYDVKVDYPEEYEIATSGILNDDTGYYHAENVRSFGIILFSDVNVIEKKAKDIVVKCYYHPDGKKCAEMLAETAVDVINFYRERFGFYPQPSLVIIPGMDRPAGGYPVATNIVSIHGMACMDEMPEFHWQWITAHEIGHQYWMEYVLSKDPLQDIGWLLIGLGIHADREYARTKGLSAEKHKGLMTRYIEGVRQGNDTTVNISAEEKSKINFDYNNVVIHGKGYAIISALDCLLGPDVFGKVYQQCLNEFGGRRMGVSEFQAVCEEVSNQDLGWFFEQWLNTNKYLSYEISKTECKKQGDSYISKIEVKCLGKLYVPVPVEAVFEDGDSQIEYTDRLLDTNKIQFESKSPLKDARLDPENALAMAVVPPSVDGAQLSREVQGLPWTGAGEKALEVFKKTTKATLLSESEWFKLGMTLYDGKYYAESLKAFESAAQRAGKGSNRYYTSKVWQGHNLDLLGRRDKALECYREALKCKQKGNWVRHDQYRMAISHKWVQERIEKPFVRDAEKE